MSSHLPAISSEQFVRFFLKRGFVKKSQKGSHIRLQKAGIKRPIVIVANEKQLPDMFILKNLNTAGISRNDFIDAMKK